MDVPSADGSVKPTASESHRYFIIASIEGGGGVTDTEGRSWDFVDEFHIPVYAGEPPALLEWHGNFVVAPFEVSGPEVLGARKYLWTRSTPKAGGTITAMAFGSLEEATAQFVINTYSTLISEVFSIIMDEEFGETQCEELETLHLKWIEAGDDSIFTPGREGTAVFYQHVKKWVSGSDLTRNGVLEYARTNRFFIEQASDDLQIEDRFFKVTISNHPAPNPEEYLATVSFDTLEKCLPTDQAK